MWRATFPRSSFDAGGPFTINKVGSFVILDTDFFQVWCTDERVRRRALLERIDTYLSSRTRIEQADVSELITQIARQLELGAIDMQALIQMANEAGKRDLATYLKCLD